MTSAMTDIVELIVEDFPEIDVKEVNYGFDKVVWEKVNWLFAEALMRVPELPLLAEGLGG